jgi:hypothetical protein
MSNSNQAPESIIGEQGVSALNGAIDRVVHRFVGASELGRMRRWWKAELGQVAGCVINSVQGLGTNDCGICCRLRGELVP